MFGIGGGVPIFVDIVAVAPAEAEPPAAAGQPDLRITDITLNPATPKKGQAVAVKVTSMNKGNTASGAYTVQWWAGELFGAPACTWNIGGMVAQGGQVSTCIYAGYPSVYDSINTKAVVDSGNNVAESNEGNNNMTKAIVVEAAAAAGQPDLRITDITLIPAIPKKGHAVTVKVTSMKKGNPPAGAYTIKWWPGELFGAPACTWNIGGMVAQGGQVSTCNYAGYPSVYDSINTKAVVDTANTVVESNEGNNTLKKAITVIN